MSPVITKQKGLFLGQLFYALKVVNKILLFLFLFFVIGALSSFIMFIQKKTKCTPKMKL